MKKNIVSYYMNLMEDARAFSNYVPNALFEKQIQMKNGIQDNEAYRRYLTNNTNRIMKTNKVNSLQQNIPMIFTQRKPGPNVPHVFDSIGDTQYPYGYETNTVKSKYLSIQELASKKVNVYKHCNV